MKDIRPSLNRFLAILAICCATLAGQGAVAEPDEVERLLQELSQAGPAEGARISAEIEERWSSSGSPAMDYLMMRGEEALEAEDYTTALRHLTLLTDHAPQFAQGWNLRATAFFHLGRYGEALHDIEQALALNPQHFNALEGLGMLLNHMGYEAEALEALEAVLAIYPHKPHIAETAAALRAHLEGTAL